MQETQTGNKDTINLSSEHRREQMRPVSAQNRQ